VWCTFCEEQIDLDVTAPKTKEFIRTTLKDMCRHGAAVIRLDAFAYAIKKPDTNCFFIEPDIWDLLYDIEGILKEEDTELLPEIHEHYTIPLKIAKKGFWVYDFALPVLTLHALYNHTGTYLKHWMDMCPMKQFTTLDTHDGIGIVDVKDLLPDEEVEKVKTQMYQEGANVKKIYSSEAYNNLDVYQVNTTYYSALGNNDDAYLLARAIQFFAPGIPQVYYVGLLAGANDIKLMEETKNGRDINRHYYSMEEVKEEQKRDVVAKLKELMVLRNTHPAFGLEGSIRVEAAEDKLKITRQYGKEQLTLDADLTNYQYRIY
jgi:sucrose phosphorylase